MPEHHEEMLSGNRYLVCTYANGKSSKNVGRYRVVIYTMYGSEIEEEDNEYSFGEPDDTHPRMDLLAIKKGLESIGPTDDPIVVLTRLEYVPLHLTKLRSKGFRRSNGKLAANADVLRDIATLDPDKKVEWRFAHAGYEQEVELWKSDSDLQSNIDRALTNDPYQRCNKITQT